MTIMRTAMTLGLLAVGAASAAAAQPKPETRAAVVQALMDCRKVSGEAARLSCYDAAATALDEAEAKGDVVVVDREQARNVRRQAFGFSMPSITLFERGEAREDLENVTGVVTSARRSTTGKWTVRLEDGAVWTQVDSAVLMQNPKPGMTARIRRASLGSFMMTIDGKSSFRAHRVE